MSVFKIRQARRAGARLVFALCGPSGSGKTRTALELAFGLAKYDASKVGLLDTENRRGSLYADCLLNEAGIVQRFLVGDLEPPFSPERYVEAIKEFQKAGVEVLVIDSGSHEWEGEGGCEDIAHAGNPRVPAWNKAKAAHKRFLNYALQCNMHIIVCLRAREKVRMFKDGNETKFEPLGMQPICEKNFLFEVTVSLMMFNEGTAQDVIKCPGELQPVLGRREGYITAADGAAVRAWVDTGELVDPQVELARNTLRTTTAAGVAAYHDAWKKTPKAIRDALMADGTHNTLKTSAEAFDKARQESKPGGAALGDLNQELAGG